MIITRTDKLIIISAQSKDNVVTDGILTGDSVVISVDNNTISPDYFSEIPKNLIVAPEYFEQNSEYAEGGLWDSVQDYGNQKDYSYAFANWSASKQIIPKYSLSNVEECMYALKDCKGVIDARNLVFHIVNDNPNMLYVCTNCTNMVYAPRFIFKNAPIVRNYLAMYSGCLKLEQASVYWGDGSTDPYSDRSMCQNMFFKCASLKEIEFLGSGSPNFLDLSYCKELSIDSVISLANSLQTVDPGVAEELGSSHIITLNVLTHDIVKGSVSLSMLNSLTSIALGEVEYENATSILSYFTDREFLQSCTLNISIFPTQSQDNTPIADIYMPNGDMYSVNGTDIESNYYSFTLSPDTDIFKDNQGDVKLALRNCSGECRAEVEFVYSYSDLSHLFTDKGWSIKGIERAESIIL